MCRTPPQRLLAVNGGPSVSRTAAHIFIEPIVLGKPRAPRARELRGWGFYIGSRSAAGTAGDDMERLIGLLQERYGYARERAAEEIDRRFREAA